MMTSNDAYGLHPSFYSSPYVTEHSPMAMEVANKMMPSSCHPPMRQQQAVIVSRCEAPSSDVSATTSSSSSPLSAASTTPPQCRKPDVTNNAMINGKKIEPMECMEIGQQSIYVPAHIGYGVRCSSPDDNSNSTPSDAARIQMSMRRSRSSQEGVLKCQFCPKKEADRSSLEIHMQNCRSMRTHECSFCRRRFKARGGLQQHMRIHNNDRPYPCKYCTKRFTQKSHVDQHERIHTGVKPFNCQICGRSFRQRSQQMGHEATHATSVPTEDRTQMNQSNVPNQSPSTSRSNSQTIENHLNDRFSIFRQSPSAVSSLLVLSQSNHVINDQQMLNLSQHHLPHPMNSFNPHNMPHAILNQMR